MRVLRGSVSGCGAGVTRQRREFDRLVAAKTCHRCRRRRALAGGRCRACRQKDSDYMREFMRRKRGSALASESFVDALRRVVTCALKRGKMK